MSRIVWLVAVCGLTLTATSVFADDPKPAKKADPLEQLLATLDQEVQLKEGANVNEIPLFELLESLTKKHGVTFTLNEDSFKSVGMANIKEEKPRIAATRLNGFTLRQFLNAALEDLRATYLIRNGAIEIVSLGHAASAAKTEVVIGEDNRYRLKEPLVSAAVKEKPLNEVVAKLAEMYDLTVIVSPQAGDAKTGFVTARLLNLPADKAIELLALQCDLRVVRKGNAFLLTSRDHLNELFGEKLDKERQKIEVEQLRKAPAKPPAAPEKPPAP